jgi:hypothetical protein
MDLTQNGTLMKLKTISDRSSAGFMEAKGVTAPGIHIERGTHIERGAPQR